jgi:cellobiose phosphorylase
MNYGNFSQDGKEYIINRPDTPKPWINYLSNDIYHALVSQTGGGFSYYRDCKYHRIHRWAHIDLDQPGRYLYIRESADGETWTPNWQPIQRNLDKWETRHGLGYTTVSAEKKGLEIKITYLVPVEDPVELWVVKLKNNTSKKREFKSFAFAEWVVGDQFNENDYQNIMCLYNRGYFDKKDNAICVHKEPTSTRPITGYAFFTSDILLDGFDCRKLSFLGQYRSWDNPVVVEKGDCTNSSVNGEDMVGVLQHNWSLKPGEEKEIVFALGYTEHKEEIEGLIRKYRSYETATKSLNEVKSFWLERVDGLKIETPDKAFDRIVNIWGKYQLLNITRWRSASYYYHGDGGQGYRDTAQDVEGLLSVDLQAAESRLRKLLSYQYNSGHAVSGFSDIEGPWEGSLKGGIVGKSDVAVWIVYAVIAYLKETGNYKFLEEVIPFVDGDSATVYEHIKRVISYLETKIGKRGFPLIGRADWNDALDKCGINGRGESVWTAMALCRAMKQLGELAEYIHDIKTAQMMNQKYLDLAKKINQEGWDGKWYRALYTDEDRPIGTEKDKEGKIFLNPQTWALLSGVSNEERTKMVISQVDKYLASEVGYALLYPAYTSYDPTIGRISAFSPGTKENAAVFSHAVAFLIVALCQKGLGDKAFDTFSKVMPTHSFKQSDKYRAEPYVYAEYCVGPGHPYQYPEGQFAWNTGTAPWMWQAATEWILGARREFDGLFIDPCLPPHFKKCKITRPFRGDVYEITIENPDGVEKGVLKIELDGVEIKNQLIKPFQDGKRHQVNVLMGLPKIKKKKISIKKRQLAFA